MARRNNTSGVCGQWRCLANNTWRCMLQLLMAWRHAPSSSGGSWSSSARRWAGDSDSLLASGLRADAPASVTAPRKAMAQPPGACLSGAGQSLLAPAWHCQSARVSPKRSSFVSGWAWESRGSGAVAAAVAAEGETRRQGLQQGLPTAKWTAHSTAPRSWRPTLLGCRATTGRRGRSSRASRRRTRGRRRWRLLKRKRQHVRVVGALLWSLCSVLTPCLQLSFVGSWTWTGRSCCGERRKRRCALCCPVLHLGLPLKRTPAACLSEKQQAEAPESEPQPGAEEEEEQQETQRQGREEREAQKEQQTQAAGVRQRQRQQQRRVQRLGRLGRQVQAVAVAQRVTRPP